MAEFTDLSEANTEIERLTSELANVSKGPQWRNLESERDTARANEAKYKGLFETAREQLVSSAVRVAGFKPNDEGVFEGPAGLVVEKFASSLGDEDIPAAEAFAELAAQYGVVPAAAGAPAGNEPTTDLAKRLAAAQAGGEALANLGQPLQPKGLDDQIAEAEAKGDVSASMALKAQKLRAAS